MTPSEAITIVNSKACGRTRWVGQEDFLDEVLVLEIERLRTLLRECDELLLRHHEAGFASFDGECPVCSYGHTQTWPNAIFSRIAEAIGERPYGNQTQT